MGIIRNRVRTRGHGPPHTCISNPSGLQCCRWSVLLLSLSALLKVARAHNLFAHIASLPSASQHIPVHFTLGKNHMNSNTYIQPRFAPSTAQPFMFYITLQSNVSFSAQPECCSPAARFPINAPCYPANPEGWVLVSDPRRPIPHNPSQFTSSATIPR